MRLTETNPYWMGEECWTSAREPGDSEIDEVYKKLWEYENTGFQPEEIPELRCYAIWEDGPGRSVEILRDWYLHPTYVCSACKNEENRASSYCPNCGACMDLGCHYE